MHASGECSPGRKEKGLEAWLSMTLSATMERPSWLPVTAVWLPEPRATGHSCDLPVYRL